MKKLITLYDGNVGKTKLIIINSKVARTTISFIISGNIALMIIGMAFSIWLNGLFTTPIPVLLIGLEPFSAYTIENLIIPCLILFLPLVLVTKAFKRSNYVWFFAGASLMSFWFAMRSLFEISIVWLKNNAYALPDIYVENPMPAIYTYKLFKSIFFASLFGLIGYWVQILRSPKDNHKKPYHNDSLVGDDI